MKERIAKCFIWNPWYHWSKATNRIVIKQESHGTPELWEWRRRKGEHRASWKRIEAMRRTGNGWKMTCHQSRLVGESLFLRFLSLSLSLSLFLMHSGNIPFLDKKFSPWGVSVSDSFRSYLISLSSHLSSIYTSSLTANPFLAPIWVHICYIRSLGHWK